MKKQYETNKERLVYTKPLIRVTGGYGGEAILILGSEKTALYDCGMACFADKLIENISTTLSEDKRSLDYIILSHTHYDHIGGLAYVLDKWPNAKVCGSKKAKEVLENSNALNTMKLLGEAARKNYHREDIDISVKGLRVDRVLRDGDDISLGRERIIALETKGHTDCSLSYYILPEKIMLASESTGVCSSKGDIAAQPLKSYSQTIESAHKLEKIEISELIIPHYGRYFGNIKEYFEKYVNVATEERNYLYSLFNKGYTVDEVMQACEEKVWKGERRREQPYEAYRLNTEIIINRLYKKWKG